MCIRDSTGDERVVKAAGRSFDDREEFREFVIEAVKRAAGVVRLDVAGGEGDAVTRRIALAVRPERTNPKFAFLLPVFTGVTGQTQYRLSLLPIGGYVKMAGDIPGELTGAPDEFLGKSVGQRGMVFVAGSVMNAIFGVLVFILAYQVGVQSISPDVGDVIPGFPAYEAGVRSGDRIVSINGRAVHEFFDIPQEVAYASPDDGLRFGVIREGHEVILPPPDEPAVKNYYDSNEKRQVAGIMRVYMNRVDSMDTESELYRAGLRPKDRIVEIAGAPAKTQADVVEAFARFLGTGKDRFTIMAEREGKRLEPIEVAIPGDAKRVWRMGVTPSFRFRVAKTPATGIGADALQEGDVIVGGTYRFGLKGIAGTLRLLKTNDGFPLRIAFEVLRGSPEPVDVEIEAADADELEALASSLEIETSFVVKGISARSNFAEAGVPLGAEILAVGGGTFASLETLAERLNASGGAPVELAWKTDESPEIRNTEVHLVPSWSLGLGDLGIKSFREKREYIRLSFFASVSVGAGKSVKFAHDVFRTLRSIFITRSLGGQSIGGPVTIAVASYYFAEYGFGKLLFFLGLLSINLAIINLFPIPILDGGHLLFLLIEKIKGSPLSETVQALAQYAGLLILLSLMVYVTRNDILRLLS